MKLPDQSSASPLPSLAPFLAPSPEEVRAEIDRFEDAARKFLQGELHPENLAFAQVKERRRTSGIGAFRNHEGEISIESPTAYPH